MSDNQNPNIEDVVESVSPVVSEAAAVESNSSNDKPSRESRPQRGDRPRGNRRDGGMREEEKEFREEMLSIDRVTRVTA